MKYKAIICDVDGTLMHNKIDGVPSEKVTIAVKKAQRKVHVGLATARSLQFSHHLFDHLSGSGPSILLGGCQIIDSKSRQVLSQHSLSVDTLLAIFTVLRKLKSKFFIDEPEEKFLYTKNYMPKTPINVYVPQLTNTFADEIKNALAHIPSITIHKATDWGNNRFALNIAHAHATKQHAVLDVAKLLDISTDEIIGIGDGYNDFALLIACGLKVAMGNAVSELKEIADYIAPSVDEDGVADVIERFVLNPCHP